jgi:hypothetical protein
VAQDVDKSLKSKYKAKDFHKISSENKTGTKKSMKGKKKNEKRERLSTGERKKGKEEPFCSEFLPSFSFSRSITSPSSLSSVSSICSF